MAGWEPLGPCTIEISIPPGTETDYAGEFLNVFILHAYEEIGERRVMLDESVRAAAKSRADGLRGDLENDLTAVGLYKFLYDNDLVTASVTVTQTESGASWTGDMSLSLPTEIGADEFGAPVASSIEFEGAGKATFTPATTTP